MSRQFTVFMSLVSCAVMLLAVWLLAGCWLLPVKQPITVVLYSGAVYFFNLPQFIILEILSVLDLALTGKG